LHKKIKTLSGTLAKFTGFFQDRDHLSQGSFDSGAGGPYHARAMGNPLRDRRTAAEWAAAGQVIEINEKLGDFERLAAIIDADLAVLEAVNMPADWREERVSGELQFSFIDARGSLPALACTVAVTVDAVCQRCLEAFRMPLAIEDNLLLLEAEQTVEGYDEYEVWELEEATLCPADIVEELLVMALPFAAMHTEAAECRVLSPRSAATRDVRTPFAALREQMADDKEGPA